jgi:peptidoglycan/LPS O-acetylase OafA/YrhL
MIPDCHRITESDLPLTEGVQPLRVRPASEPSVSYNLDFLRACAVLFVFVGHLLQTLHIETVLGVVTIYDVAHTGVLIFFVHTSLVLMLSLERQSRAGGERLLARFYIRRAFRIYPLAIAIVIVMVLGRVPSFPTLAYSPPTWTTIVSNVALIQNLTNDPSLYAPLWSLPYEVQMYVVLPFLFVYIRNHWQQEGIARALWVMAAGTIAISAMTRISAVSVLYYVPCFLAGVVAERCRCVGGPSRFAPDGLGYLPCARIGHPADR